MATLAQHTAARNDTDLLVRLIAAAEQASIPNAQQWAEQHRGALVSAQIGDTSISDVFAFAQTEKATYKRAGEDPAYVTDAQISAAVQAVRGEN